MQATWVPVNWEGASALQDTRGPANGPLLDAQHAGKACAVANLPTDRLGVVGADERRATAMRSGDSRLPALACARAVTMSDVTRLTSRSPGRHGD